MSSVTRKVVSTVVIGLFIAPLLVACGSKGINVSLETYKITPSITTAKAGEVSFHVTNNATDQDHEMVVVKTDLPADQLPLDANGNVDEDKINSMGEVEGLTPGTSKDLTLTLEPGHYVLMCNMPGHYKQGMHVDFTVQ
jgi:uncharacterized cupredoxin-like copper-binding protein